MSEEELDQPIRSHSDQSKHPYFHHSLRIGTKPKAEPIYPSAYHRHHQQQAEAQRFRDRKFGKAKTFGDDGGVDIPVPNPVYWPNRFSGPGVSQEYLLKVEPENVSEMIPYSGVHNETHLYTTHYDAHRTYTVKQDGFTYLIDPKGTRRKTHTDFSSCFDIS